ncbi:MAG: putative capsular polysaccharide synthesis family protein [Candidatus Hodarchaeota archaeon]
MLKAGLRKILLEGRRTFQGHPTTARVWNFAISSFQHYIPRLWYLFWFYSADLRSKERGIMVLIYQMGKVGSNTIKESLWNFDIPAYHFHRLTRLDNLPNKKKREAMHVYWIGRYFLRHLKTNRDYRKMKIITLVRDPVAKNVSGFFQQIESWYPTLVNQTGSKKLKVKDVLDYFLENFNHDASSDWFDLELKKVFRFDVYGEPFSKTQGYKIYKGNGNHPDILLLKLEKLNECAQEAFKEFLGIKGFRLTNWNLASQRFYYLVYQEFFSSKVLPRSYIEKMYASRSAQHFYTEEELNNFRKRWIKSNEE